MRDGEPRPRPFSTREARRLGLLFAIVYFAQGMVYLPDQVVAIVFKERGLTAGQLATFTWIITTPWFIKPLYGLLSDFVPLAGTRRRSYFLIMAALAAVSAVAVSLMAGAPYWALATVITLLWLGVGFTDVLTDALMVENGKPLGLTGAFQSVQWAALSAASILVGVAGGYLAEHRAFAGAFALVACFPLISLLMAWLVVHEPPARRTSRASARPGPRSGARCAAATCGWWPASSSSGPSARPSAPPSSTTRRTRSTSRRPSSARWPRSAPPRASRGRGPTRGWPGSSR